MSVLVDTGAWYAWLDDTDKAHDQARTLFAELLDGQHGAVFVTTDIVDEALTLLLSRRVPLGVVLELAGRFGLTDDAPTSATQLKIDERDRELAWRVFSRHYEDRGLSFTDATSLVVLERRGIDALATFDAGFGGLVPIVP